LRLQKLLSKEKEIHISASGVENEFSNNEALNDLNLDFLVKNEQLKSGRLYDLDYDNQFVACEKYDSKKGYKMKKGCFSRVATIGKHIVYLENRNGNSNVKFKQQKYFF
jgi:hypothetical protein